jgi:WD40 repeat protein
MTRSALLPSSAVAELQSHASRVNALETIGSEFVVASASNDVTIKFWDVRQGLLLGTLSRDVGAQGGGHAVRVNCLAALADNMLVSGGSDSNMIVWDTSDVRNVYRMGVWNAHLSAVLALVSNNAGVPRVYSGGDDHIVKVSCCRRWYCKGV